MSHGRYMPLTVSLGENQVHHRTWWMHGLASGEESCHKPGGRKCHGHHAYIQKHRFNPCLDLLGGFFFLTIRIFCFWRSTVYFERNGGNGKSNFHLCVITDPSTSWPPHDPECQPAAFNSRRLSSAKSATALDDKEYVAAFRERQKMDLKRWNKNGGEEEDGNMYTESGEDGVPGKLKPKPGSGWDGVWRNEDGATLADYGVDEDAEGGMEAEDEEALRAYETGAMRAYPSVAPPNGYAGVKDRGKVKGRANENAGRSTGYDGDDEEVSLAELMRRRQAEKKTPDAFGAGTPSPNSFSG